MVRSLLSSGMEPWVLGVIVGAALVFIVGVILYVMVFRHKVSAMCVARKKRRAEQKADTAAKANLATDFFKQREEDAKKREEALKKNDDEEENGGG